MPLFVLLFCIILILTPMWAILQSAFTRRLRDRCPETVDRLRIPENAFDYSFLDMIRWLGFILRREYRSLGDNTLRWQGDLLFALIVVVFCSWIGIMIFPVRTFIRIPF